MTTEPRCYDLRTHALLLDADLAEVTVVDGQPSLVVDDLFERVRGAALAGFDDADRAHGHQAA